MKDGVASVQSISEQQVPDVYRRAGGRRHYNAIRQFEALLRQARAVTLLAQGHTQADIARLLGVHRATICRDLKRLFGHCIGRSIVFKGD